MTISQVQQLHILEEQEDWIKTHSMLTDDQNRWNALFHKIINVGDPEEEGDAVNLRYINSTRAQYLKEMKDTRDDAVKVVTETATKAVQDITTLVTNGSSSLTAIISEGTHSLTKIISEGQASLNKIVSDGESSLGTLVTQSAEQVKQEASQAIQTITATKEAILIAIADNLAVVKKAVEDAQGFSKKAQAWAEGTTPGGSDTKSAKEWAAEAEKSASKGGGDVYSDKENTFTKTNTFNDSLKTTCDMQIYATANNNELVLNGASNNIQYLRMTSSSYIRVNEMGTAFNGCIKTFIINVFCATAEGALYISESAWVNGRSSIVYIVGSPIPDIAQGELLKLAVEIDADRHSVFVYTLGKLGVGWD